MLSVLTVALLLPAVIAAITGDTAGMHNIVLDKTTGDVYIDWNGNHQLLTAGRVEGWRAGAARESRLTPRLQPPPRRTQRADFPHCAPPFASRQSLWDLSCWGDFRPVASHSISVEQP